MRSPCQQVGRIGIESLINSGASSIEAKTAAAPIDNNKNTIGAGLATIQVN
jgi:hypothetical protein